MRYAGNHPESYAKNYKDRSYTHSEKRGAIITHWYDCWTHEDETRPTFGDGLNVTKTKQVDRIIRDNPPDDVQDSAFGSAFDGAF